jgi:hypothetical protein
MLINYTIPSIIDNESKVYDEPNVTVTEHVSKTHIMGYDHKCDDA